MSGNAAGPRGGQTVTVRDVIAAVGDLVEDIAVRLHESVNVASDTKAVIDRRRGGSAANMAVAVARSGRAARFIGQVGADPVGTMLTNELEREGVDVAVRVGGRSGTIVVLLDEAGERTMLTDRGSCADLADPDPTWLDGVAALHVPAYSLVGGELAVASRTLMEWARTRGALVSVDLSSAALIETVGAGPFLAMISELYPDIVLANELEAERAGGHELLAPLGRVATVVKHGARPALVHTAADGWVAVPVPSAGAVRDSTGAGDAFAAGLVGAMVDGADAVDAVRRGHQVAADALRRLTVA